MKKKILKEKDDKYLAKILSEESDDESSEDNTSGKKKEEKKEEPPKKTFGLNDIRKAASFAKDVISKKSIKNKQEEIEDINEYLKDFKGKTDQESLNKVKNAEIKRRELQDDIRRSSEFKNKHENKIEKGKKVAKYGAAAGAVIGGGILVTKLIIKYRNKKKQIENLTRASECNSIEDTNQKKKCLTSSYKRGLTEAKKMMTELENSGRRREFFEMKKIASFLERKIQKLER